MNALFAGSFIFYRLCSDCISTHQIIYYKRISPIPVEFSIYEQMNMWSSNNNILNTDFKLYGSYSDLIRNVNAWSFCNYDDFAAFIGFPRDCGPTGWVPGQWNKADGTNHPNFAFYVLNSGIISFSFSISM